jgi:hypothetical protein
MSAVAPRGTSPESVRRDRRRPVRFRFEAEGAASAATNPGSKTAPSSLRQKSLIDGAKPNSNRRLFGCDPGAPSARTRGYFQGFRGRREPLPVTSYRRITRGFLAIWSQVLRPVTRSIMTETTGFEPPTGCGKTARGTVQAHQPAAPSGTRRAAQPAPRPLRLLSFVHRDAATVLGRGLVFAQERTTRACRACGPGASPRGGRAPRRPRSCGPSRGRRKMRKARGSWLGERFRGVVPCGRLWWVSGGVGDPVAVELQEIVGCCH